MPKPKNVEQFLSDPAYKEDADLIKGVAMHVLTEERKKSEEKGEGFFGTLFKKSESGKGFFDW